MRGARGIGHEVHFTYAKYEWAMPKKITLPGGTVKTFEYDPLM